MNLPRTLVDSIILKPLIWGCSGGGEIVSWLYHLQGLELVTWTWGRFVDLFSVLSSMYLCDDHTRRDVWNSRVQFVSRCKPCRSRVSEPVLQPASGWDSVDGERSKAAAGKLGPDAGLTSARALTHSSLISTPYKSLSLNSRAGRVNSSPCEHWSCWLVMKCSMLLSWLFIPCSRKPL